MVGVSRMGPMGGLISSDSESGLGASAGSAEWQAHTTAPPNRGDHTRRGPRGMDGAQSEARLQRQARPPGPYLLRSMEMDWGRPGPWRNRLTGSGGQPPSRYAWRWRRAGPVHGDGDGQARGAGPVHGEGPARFVENISPAAHCPATAPMDVRR